MEALLLASQVVVVPTATQGKVAREGVHVQRRRLVDFVGNLLGSFTGTTARCRRRRDKQDTIQARAIRALGFVHMRELSTPAKPLKGILWHQEQRRRGWR